MLFGLFSNFQAFLKMLIRDEIISFSLKWVLVPTKTKQLLSPNKLEDEFINRNEIELKEVMAFHFPGENRHT